MRLVAPAILALVLLASAAPLASADHVYSHRYLVLGRVVDAQGLPVENATVTVTPVGFESEGTCVNQPGTETDAFGPMRSRSVTNSFGEFVFCLHAHTLPATGASLRVQALNETVVTPIDREFRMSFVLVHLPESSPQANATAAASAYTVQGRVWTHQNATMEQIQVYGLTLGGLRVNVTVRSANSSETFNASTRTNAYGDFAVRLPTTARLTGGAVVVETFGQTREESVDPSGTTHVRFVFERPTPTTPTPGGSPTPAPSSPTDGGAKSGLGGTQATPSPTPTPDAGDGNDTPFLAPLAVVSVLALVALRARRRAS